MKVVQILPTLSFGDAVGNDTIALKKVIEELGYETAIYAENIDKHLPKGIATSVDKIPELKDDDIIIYHKSTGTDISFRLEQYHGRRIMIYHNITPPEFFSQYNAGSEALTRYGYEGLSYLKDKVDYCLADSNYNKNDLIKMGYTCPIEVLPILIPFEDYKQVPDTKIIKKYKEDEYTNIIFVGRIAPNKKQENVIRAFYQYKKINPKSRLILVGSYSGMENYYERLVEYTKKLELEDVIFTGHIKFNEILAYYQIADVFLCMSEHEGFCVPLVEAMFFDVPIIAYNTSAIGDTLGGSGILVDNNDPLEIAMLMDKVLANKEMCENIVEGQRKRLKNFEYEKISTMFVSCLNNFIQNGDV